MMVCCITPVGEAMASPANEAESYRCSGAESS
jgi:hypothetical protein